MEDLKIIFAHDGDTMVSMSATEKHKVCPRCGRTLPLSAFGIAPRSKDGRACWCKECRNLIRREYYRQSKIFPHMVKGMEDVDVDLSSISDHILLNELKSRGYKGTLQYTGIVNI